MIAPTWTWAIPLIVGIIALAGVIATAVVAASNSKRQQRSAHILKIAEMRQSWINELRSTMAEFHSFGISPDVDQRTTRKFYETGTKLELLMNPLDDDYQELILDIRRFIDAANQDERFDANDEYVKTCQRILKREWGALKQSVIPWG